MQTLKVGKKKITRLVFSLQASIKLIFRAHTNTHSPTALLFGTEGGFMGEDVSNCSSWRTCWFRQRSTWRLKLMRSSLSWVSRQIGQTRAGLLRSGGCSEAAAAFPLTDWAISVEVLATPPPPGGSIGFNPSPTSASSTLLPRLSFRRCRLGFCAELALRHWSMCLLKTDKSAVSTLLKHTGQERPTPPEVDAPAWQAWSWSASSDAAHSWAAVTDAEPVPEPACWLALAAAAWTCSLFARALWKKDCWGSSRVFFSSDSSGFWLPGGRIWDELERWSFSFNGCCVALWEGPNSCFCEFRKLTMLFCRGFLSSQLTNAEILTPASTKKANYLRSDVFKVCHRSFRFNRNQFCKFVCHSNCLI